jgi:hypothetical protein
VAGKYVSRQINTSDVTEMNRPIGIRKCGSYQIFHIASNERYLARGLERILVYKVRGFLSFDFDTSPGVFYAVPE